MHEKINTWRQVLDDAGSKLADPDEAFWLFTYLTGYSRSWLFVHDRDVADPELVKAFAAWLTRRVAGEPIAYITGSRGFWTFDLDVNTATLIPRTETELLVDEALRRIPEDLSLRLADLGTGSGAVAMALAKERPHCHIHACDISPAALAVATRNAARYGLDNVSFYQGCWFQAFEDMRFDLVVANPPYIEDEDRHLETGDLRYEPRIALSSGRDGLDAIRHIVAQARGALKPGARLLMEHGYQQGQQVRDLLSQNGYLEVSSMRDLEHRERVSGAIWPGCRFHESVR